MACHSSVDKGDSTSRLGQPEVLIMSKMDDLHDAAASAEVHDMMAARMMRTSPVMEEAWRYWNAKRVDGGLPARDDLDPRAMNLIIGHSMILDRVRPGTVRVRVGGRIANSLMGMETRGLPIRAFFDLLQRGEAAELIETCFTTPATMELELQSDGEEGLVRAKMLILPLLDREGAVSKVLALIVPDRLVADAPRRFGIVRHVSGPLAHAARRPPAPVVADPMVIAATNGPAVAAPHLRVVK
jgi:hypothetical protein